MHNDTGSVYQRLLDTVQVKLVCSYFFGPLTCSTCYIRPLSPSCPYLCDANLGNSVCSVYVF